MFKGHVIKKIYWILNGREDNLALSIPTWFVINSIPLELNQIGIIKTIGWSLGDLIGLDVSM